MAITATDLKMTIKGTCLGQRWNLGCWYRLTGAAFATADPLGVAEAYWNDIKSAWRALALAAADFYTLEIFCEEEGANGQYATFPIPSGEQVGLRALGAALNLEPPYVAYGVRQTVGSRVTRPGQKRIPGVGRQDTTNGYVVTATATLVGSVAAKFSSGITLGAPVATGVMWPEVCRIDPATRLILAKQDVTGFLLNPYATTQVSRKVGRGE